MEGYYESKRDDAKVQRYASWLVSNYMAGSKAVGSLDKFWPMGDVVHKPIVATDEMRANALRLIEKYKNKQHGK